MERRNLGQQVPFLSQILALHCSEQPSKDACFCFWTSWGLLVVLRLSPYFLMASKAIWVRPLLASWPQAYPVEGHLPLERTRLAPDLVGLFVWPGMCSPSSALVSA